MLIKHTDKMVRAAQFDESLVKLGDSPQPWQFKQFQDATTYGVELLWPYEDTVVSRAKKTRPVLEHYVRLTPNIFGIVFPGFLQVPENHNLLIFPHHTHSISEDAPPKPITHMVEFDWWPLSPQVMFEVPKKPKRFHKDKPFAQAIAVPRQEYTVKEMDYAEREQRVSACQYLKEHSDEFCTRKIANDQFADQDNVYERLTQMQRRSELPIEIKDQQRRPKSRMGWK